MSRSVLGGLVGRSAEWVKAVESGRLLTPRLPMLMRLAEVLGITDLAELTGAISLPVESYTKATHEALPMVADALTEYPVVGRDDEPAPVGELADRVSQAWGLWHGTRRQRTAIAVVLPGLIRDASLATRLYDGADRRATLRSLAQVYHLAQLYLSFQPTPELLLLTGDRAMMAAQDADDPIAIGAAAWYMNHIFRDANQRHEARVELATRSAELLRPDDGGEDLAVWGLLQLAIALSHAKVGREGDALHYWDRAARAARALGADYHHPWLIFGPGMVDAYAVTIQADLTHGGQATRAAHTLKLLAMPSATRRSFHLAETGRAYFLRRDYPATVAMLKQAWEASPDTTRFSIFARAAVTELAERNEPELRADIAQLAGNLGLTVT
jgi:tetratricopeptide (TPR) repeat protein